MGIKSTLHQHKGRRGGGMTGFKLPILVFAYHILLFNYGLH